MTETRQQRKRRHLESRKALSPRNIVEFSMEQCKKVEQRNRSQRVTTLKTRPELLNVVFVSPKTPKPNYSGAEPQ